MARVYRSPFWPLVAVLVGLYLAHDLGAMQAAQPQDAPAAGPAKPALPNVEGLPASLDPTKPGQVGDTEIRISWKSGTKMIESVVRLRAGEAPIELHARSLVESELLKAQYP